MNGTTEKYHEQRRGPRVTIPEHPQVTDLHTGELLGQLVNLSADGLMIAGERNLARNTVVQMQIPLVVGDAPRMLQIGAESLWCEDANGSGTYWTGFHIIDISPEDQSTLDSIVSA